MSVYLTRSYTSGGVTYVASTTIPVTFPDTTETALIAQGYATAAGTTVMGAVAGSPDAYVTQGGNIADQNQAGFGGTPAFLQGLSILPNIALGSLALTSYETNGVAPGVIGTIYYTEIYVPYPNLWKGIGLLNGTTVGTDNHLVALYGTNGVLLANSAVAGAVTAGGSVMQNRAFTSPIYLVPGRYFLAYQSNGTSDTLRHILSANGSFNINGSQTGTFGTLPNITTVSTTFTTAIAPICQLYTT